MSRKTLRFGLHDFLNAQPLLIPLLAVQKEAGIEIVRAVPSALAEMLNAEALDLAMIPTVEYLRQADRYRLVPGVCIASRGPVSTVLLAAKVPLNEIKTLALDQRSRTSVALLQLLFGKQFPAGIEYETSAPDPVSMLEKFDAALIIGDQAFSVSALQTQVTVYDLSEEWFKRTGKAFVHAVIAVRQGVTVEQETLLRIRSARQDGLQRVHSIVENHSGRQGVEPGVLLDYLQNKIIYDLGKQELEGMMEFRDLCFDRGIIPHKRAIRFLQN